MKYKAEKLQSLLHKLTGEIWKPEQMPSNRHRDPILIRHLYQDEAAAKM